MIHCVLFPTWEDSPSWCGSPMFIKTKGMHGQANPSSSGLRQHHWLLPKNQCSLSFHWLCNLLYTPQLLRPLLPHGHTVQNTQPRNNVTQTTCSVSTSVPDKTWPTLSGSVTRNSIFTKHRCSISFRLFTLGPKNCINLQSRINHLNPHLL